MTDGFTDGTRVEVLKDEASDGPWMRNFTGVVDTSIPPTSIENPAAQNGEMNYFIRFDEPQLDAAGSGPYRSAVIWERYLRVL